MVRTQIQLTEEQARSLDELSRETGQSKADLIRESVDRMIAGRASLSREERARRALSAIGLFSSDDVTDLSENHDKYLAEAWGH